MKHLVIFAVLAITAAQAFKEIPNPPSFKNAELQTFTYRALQRAPNPCPSGKSGKVCSADCRGTITCFNGNPSPNPAVPTACATATPYCSANSTTATCVASIDACIVQLAAAPNPAICTAPTFIPDNQDCKKFTYCNGDSYTYQYYCSTGTAWNQTALACQTVSTGFICQNVTASCAAANPGTVANQNDPTSYYVCGPPITPASCPASHTYVAASGYCQFQCANPGRFDNVVDTDLLTYYDCIRTSATTIVANLKNCPETTRWDSTNKICNVPSNTGGTSGGTGGMG